MAFDLLSDSSSSAQQTTQTASGSGQNLLKSTVAQGGGIVVKGKIQSGLNLSGAKLSKGSTLTISAGPSQEDLQNLLLGAVQGAAGNSVGGATGTQAPQQPASPPATTDQTATDQAATDQASTGLLEKFKAWLSSDSLIVGNSNAKVLTSAAAILALLFVLKRK